MRLCVFAHSFFLFMLKHRVSYSNLEAVCLCMPNKKVKFTKANYYQKP